MKCLVLWEISNRYDYIFKVGEIDQVTGATKIIKQINENYQKYGLDDKDFILRNNGYNLYEFRDENCAKQFITRFSFDIAKNFEGLEICMVKKNIESSNYQNEIKKIFEKLIIKRQSANKKAYQISFGIEKICNKLAVPISKFKMFSNEIEKKIEYSSNIIIDENITKESKKNYVALINIEMDDFFNLIKTTKCDTQNYLKVIKHLDISRREALNYGIKKLNEKLSSNEIIDISINSENLVLITTGDKGIDIAKNLCSYIKDFVSNKNDNKTVSYAGVSIIKNNAQFQNAYKMAKELAKSAKEFSKKEDKNACAIDFHISQGEICNSLKYIREKNYRSIDGKTILNMRPLLINSDKIWRNYNNFVQSHKNIKEAIESSKNTQSLTRSKVKSIREKIIEGKNSTQHYLEFYKINELKPLNKTVGEYLFNETDDRCMYLDAIETIDLFEKLD